MNPKALRAGGCAPCSSIDDPDRPKNDPLDVRAEAPRSTVAFTNPGSAEIGTRGNFTFFGGALDPQVCVISRDRIGFTPMEAAVDSLASPKSSSVWTARGIVCAAGFALLLPGLGGGRVLTYHEVCFAQPAREMLANGRWIVPEIAGVVFPDKPPLAHWVAAVSMAVFGENEFAVRLPFALAGLALALIIAELATAVWNPQV